MDFEKDFQSLRLYGFNWDCFFFSHYRLDSLTMGDSNGGGALSH